MPINSENAIKALIPNTKGVRASALGTIVPDMPYDRQAMDNGINALITPKNIGTIRDYSAKGQGWTRWGNAATQAVVGEIIGGMTQGVGTILDPVGIYDRYKGNADAFEQNWLEEIGSNIQEYAREVAPIYTTQRAQNEFAPNDVTWWAQLTPSMASTLSIMIPAAGVSQLARLGLKSIRTLEVATGASKILGGAAKANKLFKAQEALNAWQFVGRTDALAKAGGATNWANKITGIVVPAYTSRLLDSSREALNRYETYYEEGKEKYKNDADGGEARAKEYAGKAAHKGYINSHSNLVFDLLEWTILGKIGGIRNAFLEDIGKVALKEGAGKAFANMSKDGIKTMFGVQGIKDIAKSAVGNIVKVGALEGFDETFMDFAMESGKRSADIEAGFKVDDGSSTFERLIKHHGVAKNWDSFVGGFLGGVGMGGVMS